MKEQGQSISNAKLPNRNRVLASCCLLNFCLGVLYMWSIFAKYVISDYGLPKEDVGLTASIMLAAFAIGIFFGGFIQDKTGPKPVCIGGSILFAIGVFSASFGINHGISSLYLTYGIIGGIGVGAAYNSVLPCCQKWFPDKKGFATGLLVCFFGFSVVVFAPLAEALINSVGLIMTWRILAIIFLAICLPASFFIQDPPKGFLPAGYQPKKTFVIGKQYTTKEMLKKPAFYFITLALMLGIPTYFILIPLLRTIAESRGLSPSMAVGMVMISGVASALGRLAFPWISDHIGRHNTAIVTFVISAVAAFLLISAREYFFLVLVAAACFSYGGVTGIFPPIASDIFGSKHIGTNYGCVMLGFGISALLFTYIANVVNKLSADGSYTLPFVIPIITCAIAVVMILLLTRSKKKMMEEYHKQKTQEEVL